MSIPPPSDGTGAAAPEAPESSPAIPPADASAPDGAVAPASLADAPVPDEVEAPAPPAATAFAAPYGPVPPDSAAAFAPAGYAPASGYGAEPGYPAQPGYGPGAGSPQAPGYFGPPPHGYPGPPPASGLATAALVLGILSLVFCWLPLLGIALGIVAAVLGNVARSKGQRKGFALTGIITGGVGIFASIAAWIISFAVLMSLATSAEDTADSAPAPTVAAEEAEADASDGAAADPGSGDTADSGVDLSSFQPLDEAGFAALTADPGAHFGENHILYGEVRQFDDATGDCQLMIGVDESQQEHWEYYDESAIAWAASSESLTEGCPEFVGVEELAHVKIWVRILGVTTVEFDDGTAEDLLSLDVHQVESLPPLP
ncbi:DUF4190 domain-containing protein [Microbacterium sp. 4R-513]|uniref:DUF4190 domain-containing protein n=1 Tax=Microbacterium sp. 4R-513 TaxID=2567934 RepID=UPI0013E127A2|nr:DUF4190 domain-containing protein [Microbacterium sp. 4R-513]QIG39327.1 DUF4190 domain-containing protein [Microbacterium sp. 4R-513]